MIFFIKTLNLNMDVFNSEYKQFILKFLRLPPVSVCAQNWMLYFLRRLSIFLSLNQVSMSTMISGFLSKPSMYGANFQPFDLVLKLKVNKSINLVELQSKKWWLYSLKCSEISSESIRKFDTLMTECLPNILTFSWSVGNMT